MPSNRTKASDRADDSEAARVTQGARESRELGALQDATVFEEAAASPDVALVREAQIFLSLEAQDALRRRQRERELSSVDVPSSAIAECVRELEIDAAQAEQLLRAHGGDCEKAMFAWMTAFPQLSLFRDPENALGVYSSY